MNHLEQYLSRATRGLYGAKKLEVQAELRGSIEARIWQLERQGNTNALEIALLEMGEAKTINVGLFKEHVMPIISKAAFMLIAAITLAVASLSSSQAQVTWATAKDNPMFFQANCGCNFFLSLRDLRNSLEKAGATVTETMSQPREFPSRPFVSWERQDRTAKFFKNANQGWDKTAFVRTLNVQLQSAGKTYKIQLQALSGYSLNAQEKMAMKPEEAEFIALDYLLQSFKSIALPIRFEGWQRPKIQIGTFSFSLERNNLELNPSFLYHAFFTDWWRQSRVPKNPLTIVTPYQANYPFRHALRVKSAPNTVYAVLITTGGFKAANNKPITYLTLVRENQQGILQFRSLFQVLEFSKSSDTSKPSDANFGNVGNEKFPARALLYKFTGRLDDAAKPVEIVLPSKTKIAALK